MRKIIIIALLLLACTACDHHDPVCPIITTKEIAHTKQEEHISGSNTTTYNPHISGGKSCENYNPHISGS